MKPKTPKELLCDALNILYTLEDQTHYENQDVGEAINLLQNQLDKL